jgi:hypothetical protein
MDKISDGGIMRRIRGTLGAVVVVSSFLDMISPVGAVNTIASSTMFFEGSLIDLGGGIYTGHAYMIDENFWGIGDNESGYDIYARNGARSWKNMKELGLASAFV